MKKVMFGEDFEEFTHYKNLDYNKDKILIYDTDKKIFYTLVKMVNNFFLIRLDNMMVNEHLEPVTSASEVDEWLVAYNKKGFNIYTAKTTLAIMQKYVEESNKSKML